MKATGIVRRTEECVIIGQTKKYLVLFTAVNAAFLIILTTAAKLFWV